MESSFEIREKGRKLFEEGKVHKEINTQKRAHFKVSGTSEEHSVIFDKRTGKYDCDCRFFTLRQKECSHILACKMLEEKNSNE